MPLETVLRPHHVTQATEVQVREADDAKLFVWRPALEEYFDAHAFTVITAEHDVVTLASYCISVATIDLCFFLLANAFGHEANLQLK
jgi:hypothetical protein